MKKRSISPKENNARVKRERDPIPWRYCLLTLICGLLLAVGFFWAARQHFSAMDLGIKNAKLRQQKESLEAEARRLFLAREISLSPTEIKKAAKKLGLQEITAQSFQLISSSKLTKETIEEPPKPVTVAKKDKTEKTEEKKAETINSEVKTKDGKSRTQSLPTMNQRTQIAKK